MNLNQRTNIVAIVVTYNRLDHLKNVITLIRNQKDCQVDIIIINNGSSDGTGDWLGSKFNQDLIIFNQENLGGAGGFNRGIKEAYNLGYDYFWLMDDDVYPDDNALSKLLEASEKLDGNYGFLASYVKGNSGKPINVPVPEMSLNPSTNYPSWVDEFELIGIKLSQATFVSVLFNRTIVKKIGLPIKEFFIWCDDYEYTYRASRILSGYYIANSIVYHRRSIEKSPTLREETVDGRIEMQFFAIRNAIFLMKIKVNGIGFIINFVKFCLFNLKSAILSKQRRKKKLIVVFRGILRGVFFNPTREVI